MTPLSIPIAAPVLIDLLPTADPPVAIINGTIPTINASEVMIIGLSLALDPCNADSNIDSPAFLFCTANSTIRIAFLANSPTSMIRPT